MSSIVGCSMHYRSVLWREGLGMDMFADAAHVAYQVPSLEESVDHFTGVLGLRVLDRRADEVFLGHGLAHACVQLSEGAELRLDHIAFALRDEAAMVSLRAALDAAGVATVPDAVAEPGITAGLRFRGPTGHVYEAVVLAPPASQGPAARVARGPGPQGSGVRPNRLGHITAQTTDVPAATAFATDVLGFQLSDMIGDEPWMSFARCNDDHHALAFMQGIDGLHHFAFEVSSINDLANLGDCLCEAGRTILWGPGRHGAGDNIALYHQEPSGAIVEYYTDMQRIVNDSWEARRWDMGDYRSIAQWGGPMPDDGLIEPVVPCPPEVTATNGAS
ncbi:MAG: VOC family protein [Solirubrobacterales bacterium]